MTVGQLEARLRRLVPRLGSRDKQTVLLAIEAMQDLAHRLHREQQKNAQTTVRFDEPMGAEPDTEMDRDRYTTMLRGKES